LLKSIIIQAWTAIEVLCEDLWNKSLKAGSSCLTRPTEKEIDKHRLGFRSRTRIRETYKFVFKLDNTEIMEVLDEPDLDAVAVLRNVLIHKSGIIDATFIKDSKNIQQLQEFRKLNLNIKLNAEIVRNLIDPIVPLGYYLLLHVDN